MARGDTARSVSEPVWRQKAVSRSLRAARSRAEQRVQRFLDAAFELIDEKGTTEFTIQEVVDRSKQSLRGFYQYFDGKDELLLALFEETVGESVEDLRKVAESESKPLDRLRAFAIRLHEWCEPPGAPRKRGSHNRRPISEFSLQLAIDHPERVTAAMAPIWRMLLDLLDGAVAAGAIKVTDTRRTALLMQQTVIFSWLGNRLVQNPKMRVTAEETWEFCLRGLNG
jgi:AcrR family transcriptional regulator